MMEMEAAPTGSVQQASISTTSGNHQFWDLNQGDTATRTVVPRGYSISQSFVSADALKTLEEGTLNNKVSSALKAVSMGGTVFDGFLLAASQEVGQSILTLPNVFSQTGFIGGLLLELVFATLALYTNYLLVSMHAQHRHNLKESGDKKHSDPYHIGKFGEGHEIISCIQVIAMPDCSIASSPSIDCSELP